MPERVCTVEGCESRRFGHGLCNRHYKRQRKHGTTDDPRGTMTPSGFTTAQIARFWAKVDTSAGSDGCWPWLGCIDDRQGYGVWGYTETQRCRPHRAAWAIHHGQPMPAGLDVDHVRARGCRRRDCCNPAHLEAVTHAENMRRLPAHRSTTLTKENASA